MKPNLEIPKETALKIVEVIEQFEIAIVAFQRTVALVKTLYPECAASLDDQLSSAQRDPDLLQAMTEKYDAFRDQIHSEQINAIADEEILKLLAKLHPTTPLN